MSVGLSLFVCPLVFLKTHVQISPNFTAQRYASAK